MVGPGGYEPLEMLDLVDGPREEDPIHTRTRAEDGSVNLAVENEAT